MVYLNTVLLAVALNMLFQNNTGTIAGAGIFGFFNIKGKRNMIAKLVVPLLRGALKNKYSAFIYQVCQLGGVVMLTLGSYSLLGHISEQPSMYHLDWFGKDIGMALGTSFGFILGGLALFFAVLYVDAKIEELDKKYEDRFKKLNEK